MKTFLLFMLGLGAVLAGAAIRSCVESDPMWELTHAWCGMPPAGATLSLGHCAGCALIGAGLVAMMTSTLFFRGWPMLRSDPRAAK